MTYDNILPNTIEINVYYFEDDDEHIVQIDEQSMREEFEDKLKELKNLNKVVKK